MSGPTWPDLYPPVNAWGQWLEKLQVARNSRGAVQAAVDIDARLLREAEELARRKGQPLSLFIASYLLGSLSSEPSHPKDRHVFWKHDFVGVNDLPINNEHEVNAGTVLETVLLKPRLINFSISAFQRFSISFSD